MPATNRSIVLSALVGFLFAASVHSQTPISFAHLRPGQEILIDDDAYGCGGGSRYTMRYSVERGPRISVTDMQPMPAGPLSPMPPPSELGTALLSHGAVQRLDNLLLYYRKGTKGTCTTVETVTFVLQEGDHEIRREKYVDATCGTDRLDANPRDLAELKIKDPPVINLGRIIWTVKEARKKGKSTTVVAAYDPKWENSAEEEVQMRREKARSRVMARDLPGGATLRREFIIEETALGSVNIPTYALFTQLRTMRPRLVDAAWWWDPVEKGKTLYDWHDFLTAHAAVERVVSRAPWVKAWKAQGKGRSVEAHIVGMRPSEEEDIRGEILPAWRHAGLKGTPTCELLFRLADDCVATVWFGRQDRRALVTSASMHRGAVPGLFFGGADMAYSPLDGVPGYAVVQPNGSATRNTRKDPTAAERNRKWELKYSRKSK